MIRGLAFPIGLSSVAWPWLPTGTSVLVKAPGHPKEMSWGFSCSLVLRGCGGRCSLLQKLWNRMFHSSSWLLLLLLFLPKQVVSKVFAFLLGARWWLELLRQYLPFTAGLSICSRTDRIVVSLSRCLGKCAEVLSSLKSSWFEEWLDSAQFK